MHQCKCANMSACLFVCLYVYMSVRVFVMYVMYVLSEFLGKDQDSYETSLVNVKSEKCRVNDNEWMTIFPIIRRMCVFLVELLVRAVWVQFFAAETGRKTSVNEALYSSERTAVELFLFELWMQIPDGSDVQLWVSLNPTQVAETHKGAERRLLSSLGTCPGTTTYHCGTWEAFQFQVMRTCSHDFPCIRWSSQWLKNGFRTFQDSKNVIVTYLSQISPAFIRAVTSVFHPLPSWKKVPRAAGDCCCSLLSWCKLEPKIGLTMINIVLFIIIYYLHIPKSRLLDTWSASEPEMSSKNDPKWLASHYYWPPKNCLLHYLSWLKFIITIHNWSNNDH